MSLVPLSAKCCGLYVIDTFPGICRNGHYGCAGYSCRDRLCQMWSTIGRICYDIDPCAYCSSDAMLNDCGPSVCLDCKPAHNANHKATRAIRRRRHDDFVAALIDIGPDVLAVVCAMVYRMPDGDAWKATYLGVLGDLG